VNVLGGDRQQWSGARLLEPALCRAIVHCEIGGKLVPVPEMARPLVKPISLPQHVGANSKSPTLADNETARAAKPTPTSIDLNDEIPF
jgi:hypothetical protein